MTMAQGLHAPLARTPFCSSSSSSSRCSRSRASLAAACPTVRAPASQLKQRCYEALHSTTASAAQRRRSAISVHASSNSAPWDPPPVSETKRKFWDQYPKPLPGIYDAVVQELLVQQHLIRWNKKYEYNPVAALGFVSVFDQVLEGLPQSEQEAVFKAYIEALDEDPQRFRSDAQGWESWVRGLSGPEELKPKEDGNDEQKVLAHLADRFGRKEAVYSKFLAIGLFRLLELSGAKDPKALEGLVSSLNVRLGAVNRDLLTYKGVLSKLGAAKELMREVMAREKKKAEERNKAKETKPKEDQSPAAGDALVGKMDRGMQENEAS